MPQEAPAEMSDEEIVRRIRQREESGLVALQVKHGPSMLRIIARIIGPSDAEDVYQESILYIWDDIGKYEPGRSSLRTWSCTVAYYKALTPPPPRPPVLAGESEHDAEVPQPTDRTEKQAAIERDLYEIILWLPPLQRAIALADLTDPPEASTDDLVATFRTTPNSIHANRSKARTAIRKRMQERGWFRGEEVNDEQ